MCFKKGVIFLTCFLMSSCMKLQMAPITLEVSVSKGTSSEYIELKWSDFGYAKAFYIYRTLYKIDYMTDASAITPIIRYDNEDLPLPETEEDLKNTDFGEPIVKLEGNVYEYKDRLEDLEDGQDRSALYVYRVLPIVDSGGSRNEQYLIAKNKNLVGYLKHDGGVELSNVISKGEKVSITYKSSSKEKFTIIYGPSRLFNLDDILLDNSPEEYIDPANDNPAETDINTEKRRGSSVFTSKNLLYPTNYSFVTLLGDKGNYILGNQVSGYRKPRDIVEFANLVDGTMYSMFFKMIPLGDQGSFVPGLLAINGVFGDIQGEFWINGMLTGKNVGPNNKHVDAFGGEAFDYQDHELILDGGLYAVNPLQEPLYPVILKGEFTIRSSKNQEGFDGKFTVRMVIGVDASPFLAGIPVNGVASKDQFKMADGHVINQEDTYFKVEWDGQTIIAYPYAQALSTSWDPYVPQIATYVGYADQSLALTNKYSFVNGAFMPTLQYNHYSNRDEKISCPPTSPKLIETWFGIATYDRSNDCLPIE